MRENAESLEPSRPPLSQTLRPDGPPQHGAVPTAAPEGSEPDETIHTEDNSMPNAIVYTCTMHTEVKSDVPGKCPKCGMTLVPEKPSKGPGSPKK